MTTPLATTFKNGAYLVHAHFTAKGVVFFLNLFRRFARRPREYDARPTGQPASYRPVGPLPAGLDDVTGLRRALFAGRLRWTQRGTPAYGSPTGCCQESSFRPKLRESSGQHAGAGFHAQGPRSARLCGRHQPQE